MHSCKTTCFRGYLFLCFCIWEHFCGNLILQISKTGKIFFWRFYHTLVHRTFVTFDVYQYLFADKLILVIACMFNFANIGINNNTRLGQSWTTILIHWLSSSSFCLASIFIPEADTGATGINNNDPEMDY